MQLGEAGRQDLFGSDKSAQLPLKPQSVNWSSWDTGTFACLDLAERWERHLRQWWLKQSQQDLSELVCLNLRDVSLLSCHFALSSDCAWGESLTVILS